MRDGGSRVAEWVGTLAAAALGCLIVAEAFGTNILPPSNTGWMLSGRIGPDPVQYWLGWTAFARDAWRWPPGANPGWGMELASSIFYADAIPLLAFVFKALRPVVEVPQYWGLWIYACGALQAVLAFKLMGLATTAPLARLSVAGLLVLQPALLGRLGGHFALGGQFLLLAGLWLCVTPGAGWRRAAGWVALVGAASLVQAYLVPMVLALWAADGLARAVDPARRGGATRLGHADHDQPRAVRDDAGARRAASGGSRDDRAHSRAGHSGGDRADQRPSVGHQRGDGGLAGLRGRVAAGL